MRKIGIIFPSIKRVWVSHPLATGYRLTANSVNNKKTATSREVAVFIISYTL